MGSPTLAGFPALTRANGAGGAALGEGTLSLRVVVRTPTVETFIQRYSRFVKDDRIFIFTKSSQPPGTRLRFTLELVDGRPLVSGEGTVTRVRAESSDTNRPPGMELSFIPTDDASRKIVQLMLDERIARGPKTASLTAPPIPPPAQLPPLPQTGAFSPIEAKAIIDSPLLRGQVAGQATDLPARPGTLRAEKVDAKPPELTEKPNTLGRIALSKMHRSVALANSVEDPPEMSKVESLPIEVAAVAPVVETPHVEGPVIEAPMPMSDSGKFNAGWNDEPTDLPSQSTQIAAAPPRPASVELAPELTEEASGVVIDVPIEPAEEPVTATTVATPPAMPPMLRPPSVTPTLMTPQVLVPPAVPVAPVQVESVQVAPELSTSAPVSSQLDADSLFNMGEVHAPDVPEPDGTPLPAPLPASVDDISFPGLEAPPAFAEGWRQPSSDGSLVPANPFSEISDNAIEYFVEWSLERSTGTMKAVDKKASASFGAVAFKPPEPEATSARRGMGFGLAVGLFVGAIFGGTVVWFAKPSTTPAPIVVAPAQPSAPVSEAPKTEAAKTEVPKTETAKTEVPKPVAPIAAAPIAPTPALPPAAKPVAAAPAVANDFAIESKPAGANVTIDGKPSGKTPLSLPLASGPHDVILTLERYADYEATVDSPGKLDAQLKRPRATLQVTSNPPGANVVVAGEPHGKTPAQVALPQYESYTVEVSLNGKAWKRKVYVSKATTVVQAVLAPVKLTPATRPAQGRTLDLPGQRSSGIR